MIVKNEEAILANCLKSIRDFVDDIVIVDTGSTDNTVDIIRDMGATCSHFVWADDFSAARNFALSQVKTPWTLWLDADDIALNPQCLQAATELARTKRISGLWCRYKQDESSYQRRLQIFKTKDFTWKGFVHENPIAKRPLTETMYSDFTVLHRKPHDRRPEAALRYLRILESRDPENWFGIAESYRYLSVQPDDPSKAPIYRSNAEELFYRAAQAPNVDPATKFIALLYCGKLNLEIAGDTKDTQRLEHALKILRICHALEPERAEPITLLGMVYEAVQEPEAAKACYLKALELPLYDQVGLVLQDYYRRIPTARLAKLQ